MSTYYISVYIDHHDCNYDPCSGIKSYATITDGGPYSEHEINIMLELLEKIDDYEYKIVITDRTERQLWNNVSWVGSKLRYSCDYDDRYN